MSTENKPYRLYVRDYCGFCNRVMQVVQHLGIDIEVRNIWQNRDYEQELVAATGRGTVPVLAIDEGNDKTRWLPESGDIIRFLQQQNSAN